MHRCNLFGEVIDPPKIVLFHDESGQFRVDEWVFIGLLWVEKKFIHTLVNDLWKKRLEHDYFGEIHFCTFAKSFEGEFGAKERLARDWFRLWQGRWCNNAYLNVLAINSKHPKYEPERFTQRFHAYNRFTGIAIKSGLSWLMKGKSDLQLSMFSDEKSRRPNGLFPRDVVDDNFCEYLMRKVDSFQRNEKKYSGPSFNIAKPFVTTLSPKKVGPYSYEEELLQLTDLLTGSIASCIAKTSQKPTKVWFGHEMRRILHDLTKRPWEQDFKLHRRVSVSCFPDSDGMMYSYNPSDVELGLIQASLRLL